MSVRHDHLPSAPSSPSLSSSTRPGAVPIFLALTGSLTAEQHVAAARRASLVAVFVIAMFALFGKSILDYLHISIAALQGAGGLLLLLVALELLTGKESDSLADAGVNVALVPLGTPLLAGPGAIVATMLAVQGADDRRVRRGRLRPRRRCSSSTSCCRFAAPVRGCCRRAARAAHPHRRPAAVGHRRADGRRLGARVRQRSRRDLTSGRE